MRYCNELASSQKYCNNLNSESAYNQPADSNKFCTRNAADRSRLVAAERLLQTTAGSMFSTCQSDTVIHIYSLRPVQGGTLHETIDAALASLCQQTKQALVSSQSLTSAFLAPFCPKVRMEQVETSRMRASEGTNAKVAPRHKKWYHSTVNSTTSFACAVQT